MTSAPPSHHQTEREPRPLPRARHHGPPLRGSDPRSGPPGAAARLGPALAGLPTLTANGDTAFSHTQPHGCAGFSPKASGASQGERLREEGRQCSHERCSPEKAEEEEARPRCWEAGWPGQAAPSPSSETGGQGGGVGRKRRRAGGKGVRKLGCEARNPGSRT